MWDFFSLLLRWRFQIWVSFLLQNIWWRCRHGYFVRLRLNAVKTRCSRGKHWRSECGVLNNSQIGLCQGMIDGSWRKGKSDPCLSNHWYSPYYLLFHPFRFSVCRLLTKFPWYEENAKSGSNEKEAYLETYQAHSKWILAPHSHRSVWKSHCPWRNSR